MSNDDQTGILPADAPAPRSNALADLAPRLISAVVMIALALAALLLGSDYFVIFWLVAGLAIVWEWQNMIDAPAVRARHFFAGAFLVLATVLARNSALDMALPLLLAGCIAVGWLAGRNKRVWAVGGLVYPAALVTSVTVLRLSLFDGMESILWLFAVVWGTDIMAYVGGRLVGGPKLWPRVSPKKTWAGFLTGCTCGALLGVGALLAFGRPAPVAIPALFAFGFVTAVVSQGGDLFESAIKRHFGVKDSSQLIPGHGGVMDRLDGFLFAAVFVAIVGGLRHGLGGIAIGVLRW